MKSTAWAKHLQYVCFVDYEKAFERVDLKKHMNACTEKNRGGLERQKTHRELIHGPESKNKNRRGMFGTRSDR